MLALDNALAEALRDITDGLDGFDREDVWPGSPTQDTPPPFVSYRMTDSRRGAFGAAGMGGMDSREYEYLIAVAAPDFDEDATHQARDDISDGLIYPPRVLTVAGWPQVQPLAWVAEEPDPGELAPGGVRVPLVGVRVMVAVSRPKA